MNEPGCFIMNAYLQGVHAPFRRDYLALSKLTRICMLAHGEAVKTVRKYAKQPVKVGMAFSTGAYVPDAETPEKIEEARRLSMEDGCGLMGNRWWMDPILAGKPVRAYGVYSSSQRDMEQIHQPLDFVGLNIYTPYNYADWGANKQAPAPGTPKNSLGWVIDDRCMYWNVRFVYERYHLPVMITENGMSDYDAPSLDGQVHDPKRVDFLIGYLRQLKRAIDEESQCWATSTGQFWITLSGPKATIPGLALSMWTFKAERESRRILQGCTKKSLRATAAF